MLTTRPVRSPWPAIQERLDATGLKGCKAVITDHGWGSVTLPNGKSVVIKHGNGGHAGLMIKTPESLVLSVLWAVATHDPEAPVYDQEGNRLSMGTYPGQWSVFVEDEVLHAEQWRIVDREVRVTDAKYKTLPPRDRVKVDAQRLIDYINEDPARTRY